MRRPGLGSARSDANVQTIKKADLIRPDRTRSNPTRPDPIRLDPNRSTDFYIYDDSTDGSPLTLTVIIGWLSDAKAKPEIYGQKSVETRQISGKGSIQKSWT